MSKLVGFYLIFYYLDNTIYFLLNIKSIYKIIKPFSNLQIKIIPLVYIQYYLHLTKANPSRTTSIDTSINIHIYTSSNI